MSKQLALHQRFPHRACTWQLRTVALECPNRPLLMGIVNVTPDSFSDGGEYLDTAAAVRHALKLVEHGADILDIGGESTRPYATPVTLEEELRRVVPVVQAVAAATDVPISIDTAKAAVAGEAISAGAEIINDVTGLEGDARMPVVARETEVGVCVMHMRGTPQTMQDDPHYDDVCSEVIDYLKNRRDALVELGIDQRRICLDPGIGFGKTHQHNLDLLASIGQFHALGCPLLVGHSRKGTLAKILQDKTADRNAATVGVGIWLAAEGVQIIRVHEPKSLKEAVDAFAAVGGIDGRVLELDSQ